MTKGIFITATGTDVGKTYICALIVKKMRNSGYNCGYYKPALSGAQETGLNDCEYVLKTAGINSDAKNFVSYLFQPSVSPHLASKIEGNPIKLEKIIEDYNKIKKEYDYLIVEGAGGIICPFGENLILPDIIKALNLDIIIVSSSGLGSINSAVLTAEYAKQAGIRVLGIILNNYDENDFMHKDNKIMIEKLTGIKVIATVSHNAQDINLINIFQTNS